MIKKKMNDIFFQESGTWHIDYIEIRSGVQWGGRTNHHLDTKFTLKKERKFHTLYRLSRYTKYEGISSITNITKVLTFMVRN